MCKSDSTGLDTLRSSGRPPSSAKILLGDLSYPRSQHDVVRPAHVPAVSRDRDMPRGVEDFPFPDGTQLVVVYGSFLVGMLWLRSAPVPNGGVGLRKHLRKAAPKQPTDASGSTTRTSAEKGKGVVELEEVPERGTPYGSYMSLDGAQNDRARLEGDVLSLTKAVTFLEAELKVEGPKAVATWRLEGLSQASR
ncbi:hypothetical protein B296_00039141 [Ensete ventricosum]|uniref:Uncharacterized protein n=1 Tax=Ensete ventricosum TaxID=4639 RepID=A0A426Z103_ENSVE|nr:hypothetical protein B296_00039141 [Ensete ventricosum]